MHEDEHEEQFLQSDGEIAMKLMINEASTFLSVVTAGKGNNRGIRLAGNECSDKPSPALLSGFQMDRQREEGGQAWSDHCLHTERVFREQEALHIRRCTRAQRFHPEQ